MPNDKSYGSPYKMRAGKMGPMQKNFGASLAINKKLDKDNMAGGLTGKPSTGELDGPLAKKKGGIAPTNKTATTRKKNAGKLGGKAKRDSILSDTNNDGNMITRGFAKAKANRKAAKAKSTAKKNNKANAVFNNAKTEQSLKKTNKPNAVVNNAKTEQKIKKKTGLEVNKNLMDKKVVTNTKKKVDHNKGLKGKTGQARTDYYNKHKLKHDDTVTTKNKKFNTKTFSKTQFEKAKK